MRVGKKIQIIIMIYKKTVLGIYYVQSYYSLLHIYIYYYICFCVSVYKIYALRALLNVELELCKEFVVVVYYIIYVSTYIHSYINIYTHQLGKYARRRQRIMYIRPHHRTGWRNDAQIRTHEMKVAAREPPIDDRPECVTIYPMTVVRGIMYELYIYTSKSRSSV